MLNLAVNGKSVVITEENFTADSMENTAGSRTCATCNQLIQGKVSTYMMMMMTLAVCCVMNPPVYCWLCCIIRYWPRSVTVTILNTLYVPSANNRSPAAAFRSTMVCRTVNMTMPTYSLSGVTRARSQSKRYVYPSICIIIIRINEWMNVCIRK